MAPLIVYRPIDWRGTEEERLANRNSHHFTSFGDTEEPPECLDCCARTYHVAADYPCGTEVPRIVVEFND